jgi:hypothetical protein
MKAMGTITLGLGLAVLVAGCNEPRYSRVWVLNSAVSGSSVTVEERGLSREACELSVLNAGRSSSYGGLLTTHNQCVTDERAAELEKEKAEKESREKRSKEETDKLDAAAKAKAEVTRVDPSEVAAAQQRTDALLKRTENLVMTPGPVVGTPVAPNMTTGPVAPSPMATPPVAPGPVRKPASKYPAGTIVFGTDRSEKHDDTVVGQRSDFVQGGPWAYVATLAHSSYSVEFILEASRVGAPLSSDERVREYTTGIGVTGERWTQVSTWNDDDNRTAADWISSRLAALPLNPGHYRLTARHAGEVLAVGEFTVKAK